MSDLRETLDELKERVEDTEDARDAVVSTNSVAIGDVPVKTAYSKNITIEEWNQLVEDMKALLSNATADRGLATELASAAGILADSILDVVSTCLPLSGGSITGDLSVGGNLTIANSEITDGTYVWTFPPKYGIVAMESDVSLLEGKIVNGLITAQKARKDGNGNVIIDTYVKKADVIDNLTSTATNKPLSANQGKALGDRLTAAEGYIDALYSVFGSTPDADTLVNTVTEVLAVFSQYPEGVTIANALASKLDAADVVDNLTTNDGSKALSAKQGKNLKDDLDAVANDLDTAEGNIADLQTEIAKKITKGAGVFDNTLGAGYADTAKSIQTSVGHADETPFAFQTTGGSSDVDTGFQELRKLVGVSVVRNQKIQNGNFASTSNWFMQNGSFSVSSNIATFTQTTPANYSRLTQTLAEKPVVGHIYFRLFEVKHDYGSSITIYSMFGKDIDKTVPSGSWFTFIDIYTANSDSGYGTISTKELASACNVQVKNVHFIDLTQTYGNNTVVNAILGNTVSDYVKRLLKFDPNLLKQVAFNAGTLSSSQSAKLKNDNRNLFDGVWETTDSTAHRTSEHYIRVIGGEKYLMASYSASSGNIYNDARLFTVKQYDINKNAIGDLTGYSSSSMTEFTLAANCAYVKIKQSVSDLNTKVGNVCFQFKWDGSQTGFIDHESQIYDLPNLVQRGILKVDSDGNVYADGDVAYPDGTGETRYKVKVYDGTSGNGVDTSKGTAGVFRTLGNYTQFYLNELGDQVITGTYLDGHVISNLGGPQATSAESIGFSAYSAEGNTWVILTLPTATASTAAQANAWLSSNNLSLHYELATPTPIIFDAFPENVWADDFGTMQYLDSDGNEIVGLQGAEFFYEANIAGFAESVYARADIDGDPSQIVSHTELSASVYTKAQADARFALKEALGGTLRQVLAMKASIEFSNTEFMALGDTTWVYVNERFVSPAGTVPNALNTSKNAVCTSYGLSPNWYNSGMPDKTVFFADDGRVVVHDSAYTDPTEFKNAMKGNLFAYEKA